MSFNVLVIPEDPTLNGYILKPLTQTIVAAAGRPGANVKVLTRPRLRGYAHARSAIRDELPDLYAHYHLWLFFPDADEVRRHPMMKEEVFGPLLNRHGDPRRPGAGRDLMINESLQNLPLLFQLCPELRRLRDRVAAHLQEG